MAAPIPVESEISDYKDSRSELLEYLSGGEILLFLIKLILLIVVFGCDSIKVIYFQLRHARDTWD
jgi:hypothetical protein